MLMIEAIWQVLVVLAPWLLVGALAGGCMHVLLPQGYIHKNFQGVSGVLKAVGLGVPLPLCSCGVIPAGLGLKEDGASDGATVAFLISTPQTGIDSAFVSASFLGWPFALFKVASAAIMGLVGGLVTDSVMHDTHEQLNKHRMVDVPEGESGNSRNWVAGLRHAVQLIRTIWGWLVVGILLSAAIEVVMPRDVMVLLTDLGSVWGPLLVLLVALPLYVCATASVPIAAALVASGFPTGAALVFLVAGPATNTATLGAIYRALGLRPLLVYLVTIVCGSITGAWLFDWLLPAASVLGGIHEHVHHSWLSTGAALVLLGIFGWFAWDDGRRWWRSRQKVIADDWLVVSVSGMRCARCQRSLEASLNADSRIASAMVRLKPGTAHVHGQISRADLQVLVETAGYGVVENDS